MMAAYFLPSARNCRIVNDCTDIQVTAPKGMDKAKMVYSGYRGTHFFKVLTAVAPNGVITFCSFLFPGSVSDKAITRQSGLLDHLKAGDMVLADKRFLIPDIVPGGVSVNIPPFLNKGKFIESEARATKEVACNHIHVDMASARIKDFLILNMIPSHLRSSANVLVHVCCALVNLQQPLIKKICSTLSVT